jgi:hypothetical protein
LGKSRKRNSAAASSILSEPGEVGQLALGHQEVNCQRIETIDPDKEHPTRTSLLHDKVDLQVCETATIRRLRRIGEELQRHHGCALAGKGR